jgi:hypothetical protein
LTNEKALIKTLDPIHNKNKGKTPRVRAPQRTREQEVRKARIEEIRNTIVEPEELEKWLSTGEAAAVLGRSRQGTINFAAAGHLRGVKTHQGWLVDPDDVARVAQERGSDRS